MAKAKLKFKVSEVGQAKLAAELSEVVLGDAKTIGDTVITEVNYKNPSQLFEMGRAIDKIEVKK